MHRTQRALVIIALLLSIAASFQHCTFLQQTKFLRRLDGNIQMSGSLDLVSLAAGSMAGALGVGVAYPLDSMKTKIQAYAAAHQSEKINVITVAKGVLKEEGIPSLYEGVLGVMLGSAAVKATAFTTNSMALSRLGESDSHVAYTGMPTIEHLTMAAAIAGLATAFVSNPIERVKVIMQANNKGSRGGSEIEVVSEVLEGDGLKGLLFRGLDASLAKDIPGYVFYFVTYYNMVHSAPGLALGPLAPIIMGALAGMFSWSLVFPLDVCKTAIQNHIGDNDFIEEGELNQRLSTRKDGQRQDAYNAAKVNNIETMARAATSSVGVSSGRAASISGAAAVLQKINSMDDEDKERGEHCTNLYEAIRELYSKHGPQVFVKGITPKLLQAGVAHSVTFFAYEHLKEFFGSFVST